MEKKKVSKKKKGFTLIEILAVLVIMSVVALITVPIIVGIIDGTRKNAYKESVRSIFTAVDLFLATNEFNDFPEEGMDVTDENLEMKYKNFVSGKVFENAEGI
ncbi:MAG: type II secretion system protein [Mollicutes bacterium]|jgi:type IV pilus assembly protein PilA|nr:type II secretion system protein [Mollicutes bacterium]